MILFLYSLNKWGPGRAYLVALLFSFLSLTVQKQASGFEGKLALLQYFKYGSFEGLTGCMDMSQKMLIIFQDTSSVIPEQHASSLPGMQAHLLFIIFHA